VSHQGGEAESSMATSTEGWDISSFRKWSTPTTGSRWRFTFCEGRWLVGTNEIALPYYPFEQPERRRIDTGVRSTFYA
jgi:hypothetical protein